MLHTEGKLYLNAVGMETRIILRYPSWSLRKIWSLSQKHWE